MKWCAFFSQTGSEIIELTNKLNKQPDFIITNNVDPKKLHDKCLQLSKQD